MPCHSSSPPTPTASGDPAAPDSGIGTPEYDNASPAGTGTAAAVSSRRRRCPGASALTVSDSPLGKFFTSAAGHDYCKLPSVRKVGPGDWRPVSLSSSFADVLFAGNVAPWCNTWF